MPRHLSLVAYNTPPTPASQDHSSCETFASAPLRLNSPLFHSHVRPPISSRAPPRLTPSAIFMASLACESVDSAYFVAAAIYDRASIPTYINQGSVAPRRTSNRRFTGDCIHSSLLRRGATEPPDSHSPPLHVLHVHPLCVLCVSASLR